ncbi:MAG: peptide deformylase [Candidatus Omnitrophica bacterium]|nr:peptide deformylase [Candidatus Omnitrophota bacterium]
MAETRLKIKTYGDPVLRRKAKPVKEVTDDTRKLLNSMAESMYINSGIGLAAPQLGVSSQMIVVDIGDGLHKLVNPKIIKRQGNQAIQEGCLSVPGACVKVRRAREVWVEAVNENNLEVKLHARDLFACVLQHEIDHLDGKLIVDYASFLSRARIKKKLAAAKSAVSDAKLKI